MFSILRKQKAFLYLLKEITLLSVSKEYKNVKKKDEVFNHLGIIFYSELVKYRGSRFYVSSSIC
jgi:hypothetical protein